jgi:hypothetical protein
MQCSNDMRRLTLLISVVLAMLAVAIPATASAKRHHRSHHHARVADRNHNGIPDRWERKFRVHSATADPDRDGVTNIGEFHNGTNPRDADSNNNGIPDGQDDANDDGIQDGQEQSGTIVSFDSGVLTVALVNGDTLKGTVDSGTEIECDNPTQTTTTASSRDDGGESNSGDQTESGDDNQTSSVPPSTSGDDENQGDDDQGDNNDDQGDNSSCGTDALTAGTIVKEAELRLTSAGAVFEQIDLGGKAPA